MQWSDYDSQYQVDRLALQTFKSQAFQRHEHGCLTTRDKMALRLLALFGHNLSILRKTCILVRQGQQCISPSLQLAKDRKIFLRSLSLVSRHLGSYREVSTRQSPFSLIAHAPCPQR